jgi:hypothetical protein
VEPPATRPASRATSRPGLKIKITNAVRAVITAHRSGRMNDRG